MNEEEKTKIIEDILNPLLIPAGFEYEFYFEGIDGNTWLYSRKCEWGGKQLIDILDKYTVNMKFAINASGYVPMSISRLLQENLVPIKYSEAMGYLYNNIDDFYKIILFFKQVISDYGFVYLEKINEDYMAKMRGE